MPNTLVATLKRAGRAIVKPATAPSEPPNAPNRDELLALVRSFPYWYQRIYLGHGVYTLPDPAYHEGVWARLEPAFPSDFRGAAVLDVGTNAGFFALQAKARNAGRVVGLESVDEYLRQAELCRRIWNADIQYLPLDAHQASSLREQFDVVIFTGILYHLKNPLQVLEDVGRICRDAIVVETEVIVDDPANRVSVRQGPFNRTEVTACTKGMMKFIESDELNGDGSNWWVPDVECVLGMLRTAGFRYFSAPCLLSPSRLLLLASKRADSVLNLHALR
jgi:tRNA (mo5U34)-methyltransferase